MAVTLPVAEVALECYICAVSLGALWDSNMVAQVWDAEASPSLYAWAKPNMQIPV